MALISGTILYNLVRLMHVCLSNLFMFVSDASLSMHDDCRWSTQDFRTELPMF